MGIFSEMDIDRKSAQFGADKETVNEIDLRSKSEAFEDARQEAESAEAQATLANLSRNDTQIKDEESEEQKRKAHEESEAKRMAEWEARKQAKEEAELFAWENALAMDDDALAAASSKRVGDESERLTRRNMKQCVTEMIQAYCFEDIELAKQVMHPRKNMVNCFRYITRKAKDFVIQEMKDNDIKQTAEGYGSDVPDDLCYQWAREYFFDMNAPEDKDPNEEKFVPKPYTGKSTASKVAKKKAEKKAETKKVDALSPAPSDNAEQLDMFSALGGVA